ncbi:MAG: hypothetical protein R3F47_10915 [Gammaproteobacteria bacterium]
MNTDEMEGREGNVLASRAYSRPGKVYDFGHIYHEWFKDGRIYCCVEHEQGLLVLDEARLDIVARVDVAGYGILYADEQYLLFHNDDHHATLIARNSLGVEVENVSTPEVLIFLGKISESNLLFSYRKGSKRYGLLEFPSMELLWEFDTSEMLNKGRVVFKDGLYIIHKRGIKRINIADGKPVWDISCKDWLTHPLLQQKLSKSPNIRTESTGIYADTLVLSLDVSFMVGIDIHTGNIRWVIDAFGPQNLRVTQDGIGWYFREGNICRLDIAKGELLAPIPVQFSPVLEKPAAASLGGFDMSTTHIIAEVSMRTSAGYTVGHIVGIRRDNGVCEWAVPIEGFVTKLYLLNNRIYATGMIAGADIATPSSKTLIIEGEGGYIPD